MYSLRSHIPFVTAVWSDWDQTFFDPFFQLPGSDLSFQELFDVCRSYAEIGFIFVLPLFLLFDRHRMDHQRGQIMEGQCTIDFLADEFSFLRMEIKHPDRVFQLSESHFFVPPQIHRERTPLAAGSLSGTRILLFSPRS